jgi:hypothetical protein
LIGGFLAELFDEGARGLQQFNVFAHAVDRLKVKNRG